MGQVQVVNFDDQAVGEDIVGTTAGDKKACPTASASVCISMPSSKCLPGMKLSCQRIPDTSRTSKLKQSTWEG